MKRLPISLPIALLCFLTLSVALAQHSGLDTGSMKRYPIANFDSLYANAIPLAETAAGRALIDSCLQRYGGVDRLESINSLRITYRMKSPLSPDSMDVVRCFQKGRKHVLARSQEVRVLNGDRAWYGSLGEVKPLDGARYCAELFGYLTLAMPLVIRSEHFDEISHGTREGDPLTYFYMNKQDSLLIVTGIDPADYLIKSSECVIYQEGHNIVFANKFSGHRMQDGFLFPHRLINIAMGVEVGNSVMKTIEVNSRFPDNFFEPAVCPGSRRRSISDKGI